jgi:3-oxoacyl-[acyl-carrier-protein] synthase I
VSSANGEQFWFREAALALSRTMRATKPRLELWHPSDCIGEVGAAAVPCAIAVAMAAARKAYAPGRGVLGQFGADDGGRVALVFDTVFDTAV